MSHRSPAEISLITYLLIAGWAMLGGLANYLNRIKIAGFTRHWLIELISDLVYSAFSGLITYFICNAYEVGEMETIVLVGMSGHMGARFIWALDRLITRSLYKIPD
jgi:hypothetical protein